jgi:S1-C subfamily serine protease
MKVWAAAIPALLLCSCANIAPSEMAAAVAPPSPVVLCYDDGQDVVTRSPAADCKGRVITANEAEALAAARTKRVRSQIAGAKRGRPGEKVDIRTAGSGFFINPQGQVLTGFHVVAHCTALTVFSARNGRMPAMVIASDYEADLAVLQTKAKPERFARFNPAPERNRGTDASVVGYPALGAATIIASRTAVEARPTQIIGDGTEFIVEGRIRSGHSGSPVLDETGRVIGMIRSKVDEVTTFRETGQFVDDVAQAVNNETIFGFLLPQHISHTTEARGRVLSDDEVLARARAFVARIECWN